ncbi:MAG: 23S rRNA (pseudouridine(1915)-N(3))-methyltransferase RlmH [Negativicutes bacterium]|nr:23S rRNA (pseudouridine(1915)-N(3))-methyltransferase RlmH [Negativicutes bacterium]
MVKIEILAVGRLKERYWQAACAEYERRLRPVCRVTVSELKEERLGEKTDPAGIRRTLAAEGGRLLARVREDDWLVVLDIAGESCDSPQMAAELAEVIRQGRPVKFAIGGALGLWPPVLGRADRRLSLGRLTYTHQLARVILWEQLYRWFKIIRGEPYHC